MGRQVLDQGHRSGRGVIVAFAVGTTVAFMFGVALGGLAKPDRGSPPARPAPCQDSVGGDMPRHPTESAAMGELAECRADVDQCRADLAGLKAQLAAVNTMTQLERLALTGSPLPWTINEDPAYDPESVGSALDEALDACPAAQDARVYLGCDEYPCLLWAEQPDGRLPDLFGCPEWPYEPIVDSFFARRMPNGEEVRFTVVMVIPRDSLSAYDAEDFAKRIKVPAGVERADHDR